MEQLDERVQLILVILHGAAGVDLQQLAGVLGGERVASHQGRQLFEQFGLAQHPDLLVALVHYLILRCEIYLQKSELHALFVDFLRQIDCIFGRFVVGFRKGFRSASKASFGGSDCTFISPSSCTTLKTLDACCRFTQFSHSFRSGTLMKSTKI
jgi:hypothetical protein